MNIDQSAMCYTSMDLSWQALQTNGKSFQIPNSFLNYWPKTEKYSNEKQIVNIDQISMCQLYINGFVSTSSTN